MKLQTFVLSDASFQIFAHGMKKEVQISGDIVDRIFPALDNLYEIHSSFLRQLRERQKEYTVIPTIGDLLIQQVLLIY